VQDTQDGRRNSIHDGEGGLRIVGGDILGQRRFHAGPEPLVVTRFRLAHLLPPGGVARFVPGTRPLVKEFLQQPLQIAGRQLAGIFEDLGGSTAHAPIAARHEVRNHISCATSCGSRTAPRLN